MHPGVLSAQFWSFRLKFRKASGDRFIATQWTFIFGFLLFAPAVLMTYVHVASMQLGGTPTPHTPIVICWLIALAGIGHFFPALRIELDVLNRTVRVRRRWSWITGDYPAADLEQVSLYIQRRHRRYTRGADYHGLGVVAYVNDSPVLLCATRSADRATQYVDSLPEPLRLQYRGPGPDLSSR